MRRDIKLKFGPKTVTTRAIIKHQSISAQRVRADFRLKYDLKELHLKKKHEARQSPMACKPQDIGEYINAKVYNTEEFDGIMEEEITISMVGQIELTDNEREVLKLHPKFAVREEVDEEDMDFQGELGYAKVRYQLLKEAEDDEGIGDELEEGEELIELTEEEKEELEMQEAKRRQFYDPEGKVRNEVLTKEKMQG